MAIIAQNRRLFTFTSPLGADAFAVTNFTGREEMSRLFSFQLDLVSENVSVAAADLVGKPVGWALNYPESAPRYFHGFVNRMVAGPKMSRTLRAYRVEVVPWLWFLTRTTDCRIFQTKTAPDIIKDVFGLYGFTAFQDNLSGSFATREYCVQYRESAFDFVSRLMEEEGIYYYFTFANGSHTMVLANQASSYYDCAPHATVEFRPENPDAEAVSEWARQYEFRSGKWTHTDYNFETPSTNLLTNSPTTQQLTDLSKYELFDYPGRYGVSADGSNLVKVRMEEVEVNSDVSNGAGQCSSFAPGGKFALTLHPADNGQYVLVSVEHSAQEGQIAGVQSGQAAYRNSFTCLPGAVPFRPARTTPRPLVHGPQPALVVGPSGEEIYTDKYGRIKAQFYWDRIGTKNENSSCWMRVAEMWAGKNWGMVFTPRIGQEVIVEFLDGDPDRPLVTGRVYNAEQMPPYALPANMTQSGLKTRSTKQGGTDDFNELRFEDKKGEEDIYFHAQKDFHRYVEHDDDLKVLGNQTISIKLDRTEVVEEGNESITIKQGNRTEEVTQGNESVTIKQGNRTVSVDTGDDTHLVKTGNRVVSVDTGNDQLTVKTGDRVVSVDTGNDQLTVKTGNRVVSVDTGNDQLTVKTGNVEVTASAGAVTVSGATKITLKSGGSQIEISPSGITMSAPNVTLTADAQFKASGSASAELSASGQTTVKGAIVMIN